MPDAAGPSGEQPFDGVVGYSVVGSDGALGVCVAVQADSDGQRALVVRPPGSSVSVLIQPDEIESVDDAERVVTVRRPNRRLRLRTDPDGVTLE